MWTKHKVQLVLRTPPLYFHCLRFSGRLRSNLRRAGSSVSRKLKKFVEGLPARPPPPIESLLWRIGGMEPWPMLHCTAFHCNALFMIVQKMYCIYNALWTYTAYLLMEYKCNAQCLHIIAIQISVCSAVCSVEYGKEQQSGVLVNCNLVAGSVLYGSSEYGKEL